MCKSGVTSQERLKTQVKLLLSVNGKSYMPRRLEQQRMTFSSTVTSLPKVIWEEGCVAALSHTYAVKSPLVTMARPKFAPKSTPSRGPIPKPYYLPHPWTRPTYDAKRHPVPIGRFSTMHWTDRQTDAPAHRRTYA